MVCISSKLFSVGDLHVFSSHKKPISSTNSGDLSNHTVSLTSFTYGVLNLDPFENQKAEAFSLDEFYRSPSSILFANSKKPSFTDPSPEIINWVQVEELEDAVIAKGLLEKKPIKRSPTLFKGKFFGKENRTFRLKTPVTDPNRVLKPLSFSKKKKSGSRRCLSPLFDPELVASFKRELNSDAEQIKLKVSPRIWKKEDKTSCLLLSFDEKCLPGGEKAVELYTTSLRGIRKTYKDCNLVRSVIKSYNVSVTERDVSMDLRFREELRKLMGGSKEVKIPLLFVKGRMVGGAEEVLRREE